MNTLKDSALTYFILIANNFFSLLASIVITRSLGLDAKGEIALILSLPNIFLVFGMIGGGQSTIFHVSKKNLTVDDLIPGSFILAFLQSLIIFFICIPVWQITKDNMLRGLSETSLIIILATTPINILFEYTISIFRGIGQSIVFNFLRLIRVLLYFLGILVAIFLKIESVNTILLSWTISLLIVQIITLIQLKKHQDKSINLKSTYDAIKKILSYGIQIYPTLILTWIGYRIDIYIMNAFLDKQSIGAYSIAVSIAEVAWYVPNAVGIVILPKIASMLNDAANKYTPLVLRQVNIIMMVVIGGLFIIGKPVILLAFGEDAEIAVLPLYLLLPGVFAFANLKIIWQDLCGRGSALLAAIPQGLAVVTNIILVIILAPTYGIKGAAVASSASYLIAGLLAIFIFAKTNKLTVKEIITPTHKDKQIYISLFNWVRALYIKLMT